MAFQRSAPGPLHSAGAVRRSRSMHDAALQDIGRSIVSGAFPVGSLLPSKDEMMARLDVSQTTLREALQTLTAKGMVAARAKVGTRVLDESHWNMFDAEILQWRLERGIDADFLARLFEIRQVLEPTAAALMAARGTDRDLERLEDMARALWDAPDDKARFVSADIAFHKLVMEASGNPFMRSLEALIHTSLIAAFALSEPTGSPDLSATVRRQHLAVVAAIVARDPQRAGDAMREVIMQGWQTYAGARPERIGSLDIASFAPL